MDRSQKVFRPKVKMEAVQAVLAGESSESVADRIGADPALVSGWHDSFLKAGKAALRFTGDPGEVPRLRDVQLTAQRAFPTRLLNDCRSAAAFFVAQFYGKNDVVHIYNAGIPRVTLVDVDRDKLDVMREIYPSDWDVLYEDAFAVAERFASEGRKFDLVTCDAYSPMSERVAWDTLDLWESIANRYLMLFYTTPMLEQLGAPPEAPVVADAVSARLGRPVRVIDLIKRSSHLGGVYWCVIGTDSSESR